MIYVDEYELTNGTIFMIAQELGFKEKLITEESVERALKYIKEVSSVSSTTGIER